MLLTFGDDSEVNTRLSGSHCRFHSCRDGRVGCKTRKKDRKKTRNKNKKSRIGKEGEVKKRKF
jgi:hypothetical protein